MGKKVGPTIVRLAAILGAGIYLARIIISSEMRKKALAAAINESHEREPTSSNKHSDGHREPARLNIDGGETFASDAAPNRPIGTLKGIVDKPANPVSIEDMNDAIAAKRASSAKDPKACE